MTVTPPLGEQAGCLARSGPYLQCGPDRLIRVRQHHVNELDGIPRPDSFVCFRLHSEAQCAASHAEHPDTIRAVNARSFRVTRVQDDQRQGSRRLR